MTASKLSLYFSCILAVATLGLLGACSARQDGESGSFPAAAQRDFTAVKPQDGAVWMEAEGFRGAWVGEGACNEQLLDYMVEARCNVLILTHNIADFLDLHSAHWEGTKLVVDYHREFADKLTAIARQAAARGIRTIFNITYELPEMLPTLKRLGYCPAYVEGPTRFVPPGKKDDASPFDKTLWQGLIGAYGEHVARLSLDYPIAGIFQDTEHYDGGIMYLQGCGFSDDCFLPYAVSRRIAETPAEIPAGTRYEYLKSHGLLRDYYNYLEEQAYRQGRELATRWRAVNPNLLLGIWVLFDNWFSRGYLRGLGGEVPALGLSHCEYWSGSFQTRSMAEYFQSKNPNLKYMPGFLRFYQPDEYQYHVAEAIRATGGRYWMLSPYAILPKEAFRAALRRAYENGTPDRLAEGRPPIDLEYTIDSHGNKPVLIVATVQGKDAFGSRPLLTLRSVRGGASLCEAFPMELSEDGRYRAEVPLVRLLTNNRYQPDGFRSGVCYEYAPVPRRFLYEDPDHTKLIDGRAYGFYGTTVAWDNSVDASEVLFDLHRPYRILRVAVSQPTELEDGHGGPSQMTLDLGDGAKEWTASMPFRADFRLKPNYEPNTPPIGLEDGRHERAWLNWFADDVNLDARWLRIRLRRTLQSERNLDGQGWPANINARVISLGEVLIWGLFNGQVQASLTDSGRRRAIRQGWRFAVPADL